MVPISILCRKHLLGEHVECHMFRSALHNNQKLEKFVLNNLFQPLDIKTRHDMLAAEMKKRNYKHNSPMKPINHNIFFNLPIELIISKVNIQMSINDLIGRCEECRKRYLEGRNNDYSFCGP